MSCRNLDGIYTRVKRGEKYENVCLSDLTPLEREEFLHDRPKDWYITAVNHLCERLQKLGEEFDIKGEDDEENH